MIVLGLSAFYHDSAAAIVRDGVIVAAVQQERFSRKKNDSTFPADASAYCLDTAGVTLDEVDFVGFYDKPLLTFDRLLETYFSFAPAGLESFVSAIPVWVKEKILQKNLIISGLNDLGRGTLDPDKVLFGFHHHSHAASAYYPSPFDRAAVLVMDGVGEWATTSYGVGKGRDLTLTDEIRFPHSLGMLYSAFTYYLGFKVNDGEYKVMGMAPYGEPKYADLIREHLIDLKDDGSFHLNMDYFNYCTGLTMTNDRFADLFGGPRRDPAEPPQQRHMDLARSVQDVLEDAVLALVRHLHEKTGEKNLCMAGGVALNCVANGRIQREGPFENIWIQPAAGDAGSSLGVALAIANAKSDGERQPDVPAIDAMRGTYLGPDYNDGEIRKILESFGATFEEMTDDALFPFVAQKLAGESIIGWFQGRMEFGPRSLGNRSILGDPHSAAMQQTLNLKIKYRESFRPFAPAILNEDVKEYFDLDTISPYMLLVSDVTKDKLLDLSPEDQARTGFDKLGVIRSDVPAITHVDNSARVQTVHIETNPRFHRLLTSFKKETGRGVLVNTSFNVRDEPIVCSPEDAYKCFMATEMDVLVLGNYVLLKEQQ
ncbi:MAG: carbamoyltransferase [Alphaproteobacteria bacterium]|jgi:carbamoyltransferase|nr:carbamoyltransferase [Alphaproteobacteria bacterium]